MSSLIFQISLNENASKVIEIKSTVLIKNRLNYKIQCRVESLVQSPHHAGPLILEIDSEREAPIPIKYVPCVIWFRPVVDTLDAEFSENSINLDELKAITQVEYIQLKCKAATSYWSASSENTTFYFFARVKRHQFPIKKRSKFQTFGFTINVEPAMTLYNLLPIEFNYKFLLNDGEKSKKLATLYIFNALNFIYLVFSLI